MKRASLLISLLAFVGPAHAADMDSVSVITGGYPTAAPSALSSNVVAVPAGVTDIDIKLKASAGSGTYTLICYTIPGAEWWPIGDESIDSSVYGGHANGRFSPGAGLYTHCAIWEKASGATITEAYLAVDVKR